MSYADRGGSLVPEIAGLTSSAAVELRDVHISEPSLENLFLHHTGRSLRNELENLHGPAGSRRTRCSP
jgi:hypothetical protein